MGDTELLKKDLECVYNMDVQIDKALVDGRDSIEITVKAGSSIINFCKNMITLLLDTEGKNNGEHKIWEEGV